MSNNITRKRNGKGFSYFDGGHAVTDTQTLQRIRGLVIPPAWTEVEIAKSAEAKIQVSGRDSAGRKQMIYNPTFREKQETAKFSRILKFGEHLPVMRRQIEKDLARKKFSKEKVLALIVRLMDEAYFRVGNEQYARQNHTYGITTLRRKHLSFKAESVTFDFVGKSGKRHHKTISDKRIARLLKQLDALPGYEIFQYVDATNQVHSVSSEDVNAYIKTYMGEAFTAKDFRTWGGTLLATVELVAAQERLTETARKRLVTKTVKRVAKRLGNTPAVTRGSYIDPRVIESFMNNDSIKAVRDTVSRMKPKKYRSTEEQYVLQLLNR